MRKTHCQARRYLPTRCVCRDDAASVLETVDQLRQFPGEVQAGAPNAPCVLGVPRTATSNDIKRAYRKKALKLHPDVNKAPDARERFMECKAAYQDILDRQRRNSGGSSFKGAARGQGGWGGYSGSPQRKPSQPQEEFYGLDELLGTAVEGMRSGVERAWGALGDLFNDLEKEWESYSKSRRRGEASGPKSLWEELADIGEELVEFLEKGVGLTEGSETGRADRAEDIYDRYKQQYGEEATPSGQGSSQSGRGQGTGGNATQQGSSKPASGGTAGSGDGMKPPPPTSRKEAVDKELEELKRKLGLK